MKISAFDAISQGRAGWDGVGGSNIGELFRCSEYSIAIRGTWAVMI